MTNNNTTNSLPDFYLLMASSSSSSPSFLPPTPYRHPQKLRKKRSKLIKIDPYLLLPSPNHNPNHNPNPNPHSLALSDPRKPDSIFTPRIRHCCPECSKHFGSEKALYGHMRCHPDRDYRGMTRKPPPQRYRISTSSPPSSSSPLSIQEEETAAATMMSFEDHGVAECLLLLSKTGILETDFVDAVAGGGGGAGVSGGVGEVDYGGAGCSFECSSCKKVFGSHQALGGHRASHKNVKGCFAINRSCEVFDQDQTDYSNVGVLDDRNNSSNDAEIKEMAMMVLRHKCSICLRVFPSGQALGGHKRCHWEKGGEDIIASSSSSSSMINTANNNNNSNVQGVNGNFAASDGKERSGLDLNLPAPTTVEDESCSSYSSALTLDLRLGL